MNIDQLVRLINTRHGTAFAVEHRFELGESRTAHGVRDESGMWVLKWQDDPNESHFGFQRKLASVQDRLRSASYPAPFHRIIDHTGGITYLVQERLPGEPILAHDGDLPDQRRMTTLLPQLLELNEQQAGQCRDLPSTWPATIVETVMNGGREWCVHETMRAHSPETSRLLDTLQDIVRLHQDSRFRTGDAVHGDFQYANILAEDGRITGVVDWSFSEPGDRGFDLATLLFYSYEVPAIRHRLWHRAVAIAGHGAVAVYLAHLILRQVEWSIRHEHPAPVIDRYLATSTDIVERLSEPS